MLMKPEQDENDSGSEEEYCEKMKQNLNADLEKVGSRILQMKIKAPQNKEGLLVL